MSLKEMMEGEQDIYIDRYAIMESNAKDGIWTTADNVRMDIQDMKAGHIKNCISCLEDYRIDFGVYMNNLWIKILEQELERRLK